MAEVVMNITECALKNAGFAKHLTVFVLIMTGVFIKSNWTFL